MQVLARKVPYAGKDSCELVVAIICNMMPRPSLSEEESRGWPPEVRRMHTRARVRIIVCMHAHARERVRYIYIYV